MNIFKAAYCRTFQFFFKLAIPLLPYRQPKILGSVKECATVLKNDKVSCVMLVTDKTVVELGLCDELISALERNEVKYSVYDKTLPNPTIDAAEDALAQYLNDGCQAIIALGGGSVMDLAKAVGARVARPKKTLKQMAGILKVRKKLPTLFAVPTTAGTGSETTIAAVMTDGKSHRKFAVNDFPLIPRYAVLDYKLTIGLPKNITAFTGMDALTHAVEAFIGRSTTKFTRKNALAAIELIRDNLKICYDDPADADARKNMLYAAHYAGIAFTQSYVGYVHAVAHSLSGRYGLPHGLTCAVLLPIVLSSYGKKAHKKLAILAKTIGIADANDDKAVAARKFIDWVYEMNDYMGIPRGFKEIQPEDVDKMARFADKEGNPLYPVPKLFDRKQLKQIYYQAIA